MKIKAFINKMNDSGTKPRVKVWRYDREIDCRILIYEGRAYEIPDEIADMKLNSFTVSGVGFVEFYTSI